MKYEFEESYHLKVNYSCECEVDDKHPNSKIIDITCRFLEYFPLCRDNVDTSPIYFTKKPSQEEAKTFRYGPAEWLNFEIIKDFAWESKEIRRGEKGNITYVERPLGPSGEQNDDGSYLWRTPNPNDHAIIKGFKTTLFVHKEYNIPEEEVNKAVKELVENSVALITHSPMVKLYKRGYQSLETPEAGIIIESIPEWVPWFNKETSGRITRFGIGSNSLKPEQSFYDYNKIKDIIQYIKTGDPIKIANYLESDEIDYQSQEVRRKLISSVLESIKRLGEEDKNETFSQLIKVVKTKSWLKDCFHMLLSGIGIIDENDREDVFSDLIVACGEKGMIKEYFPDFVNFLDRFSYNHSIFNDLVDIAQTRGFMKEYFLVFSDAIDKLYEEDREYAFSKLIEVAKQNKLTGDYFPILLMTIKRLGKYKFFFFHKLCETAKEMGLLKNFYASIKGIFVNLLLDIDNLDYHEKYTAFVYLNLAIIDSELMDELYPLIETQFQNLIKFFDDLTESESEPEKEFAFSILSKFPKDTKLMFNHFSTLLEAIEKKRNLNE